MEKPQNRLSEERGLKIYYSPKDLLQISNGNSFSDLTQLDAPHFELIARGYPSLADLHTTSAFQNGFNEAVVEVTHGCLTNLLVVMSGEQADEITRLTYVINTKSFPMHDDETLTEALTVPLQQLHNLRILTIQIHGKRFSEIDHDDVRFAALGCVENAVYNAFGNLWNVPEIRISTNDPADIVDLRSITMFWTKGNHKMRRWYSFPGKFRGLHIFVPRGVLQESSIKDHVFKSQECNDALRAMKNTPPLLENLTINKFPTTGEDLDYVSTPFFVHRSTSAEKTTWILTETRQVRHCSVGWIDADADVLANFINNNVDTLCAIELEVCLTSGTWDQVFNALQNCALSYLGRRGAGFMYHSPVGHIQTGYLTVPRDWTINPILRLSDEYELSQLLAKITDVQTMNLDDFHSDQMVVERDQWVLDTTAAQKEDWRGYS